MNTNVIRRARADDIASMARINADLFLGDRDRPESAQEWMSCWFRAFPLYQYFVAERDGRVVGYAGWQAHGGFRRPEPIFELDQIGVPKIEQGKGIGPELTRESMRTLLEWAKEKNDRIEGHISFVVWVHAFNFNAVSAYAKEFGEGIQGFRLQFRQRPENMLRHTLPVTRPVREEA